MSFYRLNLSNELLHMAVESYFSSELLHLSFPNNKIENKLLLNNVQYKQTYHFTSCIYSNGVWG